MMRMNRILDIDYADRCATVQAGVTNIGITQAVPGDGFFYAPDPSSQLACMIGGNVDMNSGGAHCLKYGVTANNLLGLKIVTVEGEILDIGGAHLDAAGYDWLGLLTGSEGQLAMVTEVTVRILRGPEGARAMLAGVPLQRGRRAPAWTRSSAPASFRWRWSSWTGRRSTPARRSPMPAIRWTPRRMLIIEVEGSVAEQDELLGRISAIWRAARPDQPEGVAVGRGEPGDLEGPQGRVRRGRPHQSGLHVHGRHHPDQPAARRAAPHRRDERAATA